MFKLTTGAWAEDGAWTSTEAGPEICPKSEPEPKK